MYDAAALDVHVSSKATPVGAGVLDADAMPDLDRLKEVLAGHGFLGPEASRALGPEIGPAHLRRDLPLYLRRLAAPSPLNTLVKLFSLGQPVPETDAAAALAPVPLADVEAAGLVARDPRGVSALVKLDVHADLLLAHDRYEPERREMRPDHVLGTNAPARTLDCLTVRRRVGSTLDVGVGGAVQSLLAARHSERVVGIDKNPRALAFARFNARLNGVANLDLRCGDLFEPVRGERFDLVVCNPPYVISPESRLVFQDSGRHADAICEEVVRRAPDFLAEGGFASVLCNWALRAGEDWSAPLRRWVAGRGCDAWLLHSDTQDPLTYAAVWNRSREPAAYEEALDRWVEYDREAGIAAIAMGAVVLRRRTGATNWLRADSLIKDPEQPCGDQILRVFAAQDRLSALADDAALLAEPFRLAEDHRVRQVLRVGEGRLAIESAEIELSRGLGFRGSVDPYLLHLLQRCDGRRGLDDAVAELARQGGTDHARLAGVVAETLRRLAMLGFLVPSGAPEREPKREA